LRGGETISEPIIIGLVCVFLPFFLKMEKNYKIKKTYVDSKGVLMCDYTGEWEESKPKKKEKKQ
jgi:hypothetical protein